MMTSTCPALSSSSSTSYDQEKEPAPLNIRSSSDSNTSSSNNFFTCEICTHSVSLNQKFKNGGQNSKSCEESHPFCTDCISKYIKAMVEQNNESDIKCPSINCNVVLDPVSCRPVLSPRVFERWCRVLCESSVVIASARGSVYCPFRDCSELILDECGASTNSNSDFTTITLTTCSKCPNCRRLFCFQCQIPWQESHQCSTSHEGMMRDRNDILFMELVPRQKWTRCPACKHYVERTEGCTIITCRCKTQFCYDCGSHVVSLLGSCGCRRITITRTNYTESTITYYTESTGTNWSNFIELCICDGVFIVFLLLLFVFVLWVYLICRNFMDI